MAASLLFLVLAAPVMPAARAADAPDGPMACCVRQASCECRTLAGLSRCPSDSSDSVTVTPQRLPCLVTSSFTAASDADRPLPVLFESIQPIPVPAEPLVPPPRA